MQVRTRFEKHRTLTLSLLLFASISGALLALELGLRFFPVLIPPDALARFEPGVRQRAAKGRFWTAGDFVIREPDDNGPSLMLLKPNLSINMKRDGSSRTEILIMDRNGFCNAPDLYDKYERFDVVTIGDSFTWCTTVTNQETWTKKLADYSALTTYNLGIQAIGLREYLQILKLFGLRKSPRAVIMNVYEGNDLRDAASFERYMASATTVAKRSPRPPKKYERGIYTTYRLVKGSWLGRHSYALNLVIGEMAVRYEKFGQTVIGIDRPIDFRFDVVFSDGVVPFNTDESAKDQVETAEYWSRGQITFDYFSRPLKTFLDLSKQYGFIPVVAYTPTSYTTYNDWVVFKDSRLKELMADFSSKQREFFRLKSNELGLNFIDLTPALQAEARRSGRHELLYYGNNLHLTPKGHDVIARTLTPLLKELGLFRNGS